MIVKIKSCFVHMARVFISPSNISEKLVFELLCNHQGAGEML